MHDFTELIQILLCSKYDKSRILQRMKLQLTTVIWTKPGFNTDWPEQLAQLGYSDTEHACQMA
jgi:hypothetical protein